MRFLVFKVLSAINKLLLPKLWDKDLTKLSKAQQGIIGYKVWVTYNYLDCLSDKKKGDR